MKIMTTINRVSYAQDQIEIEIPDSEIPKTKNGKIDRKKLKSIIEEKAITDARENVVFEEGDAEYSLESFNIIT